jgi:hypothetical protein
MTLEMAQFLSLKHIHSLIRHFLKNKMQGEYGDTDGNRAVSDIKGGPMPVADKKIEKVYDSSESDPIDQVANRTTEYQRKTARKYAMRRGRFSIQPEYQTNGQR